MPEISARLAFAQAQRHRQHADDHGQRRHQNGTEARDTGFDGGAHGVSCGGEALAGTLLRGLVEARRRHDETVLRRPIACRADDLHFLA